MLPKSINLGNTVFKFGIVGYAYNGTIKFYVYVFIFTTSYKYL